MFIERCQYKSQIPLTVKKIMCVGSPAGSVLVEVFTQLGRVVTEPGAIATRSYGQALIYNFVGKDLYAWAIVCLDPVAIAPGSVTRASLATCRIKSEIANCTTPCAKHFLSGWEVVW